MAVGVSQHVSHVHNSLNAVKGTFQFVTMCSYFSRKKLYNCFYYKIQYTHIYMIYNFYLIVNYIYCLDDITTIKYSEYTRSYYKQINH